MIKMPRRFWTWLNADRKRFSLACLLTLFGLLLWSRLILVSNLPRTAIADDEREEAQATSTHQDHDLDQPASLQPSDKPKAESTHADFGNVPKAEPRDRMNEPVGIEHRPESSLDGPQQ
ncbi:MAG: hypothetical protein O7G85_11690 [Planctomycetota bacterium]|nr:hypothetical protein [Planctomycetota bacterium]